jgi:S1-C subfamily serine protease
VATTEAPTVVPPTEVPVTPTAIPKGQKPATAGVTLSFQAGLVRAFGKCVSVVGVTAGGPADVAGIQVGDLVLGVDRTQIKDAGDFYVQVGRHSSGDVVTITVQREDKAMSLKVTLGLNQFAEVATPVATK